jgi:hypothetical protein
MAFKQYTKCVKPSDYTDFGFNLVGISQSILLLLTSVFLAIAAIAIIGGPAAIIVLISVVSDGGCSAA